MLHANFILFFRQSFLIRKITVAQRCSPNFRFDWRKRERGSEREMLFDQCIILIHKNVYQISYSCRYLFNSVCLLYTALHESNLFDVASVSVFIHSMVTWQLNRVDVFVTVL